MARTAQQLLEKINRQLSDGQPKPALKTARLGMKQFPGEVAFANAAGLSAAQAGMHLEAAGYFDRALKLAPGHGELQTNLVQALVLAGAHERACTRADRFLASGGDPANLEYLKAMSALQQDNFEAALISLNSVLETQPDTLRCLRMRATAHGRAGHRTAALADHEHVARLLPADPGAVIQIANLHIQNMDLIRAADRLDTALSVQPGQLDLTEHRAVVAMMAGDRDLAQALFNDVTQAARDRANAWISLAALCAPDDAARLLTRLDEARKTAVKKSAADGQLLIARASLLQKTGDVEGEQSALIEANATLARSRPVPGKAAQKTSAAMLDSPSLTATSDATLRPVFVVGLPRSGTSLCDRVLSAHPDIRSVGEFAGGGRVAAAMTGSHPMVPGLYSRDLPDVLEPGQIFCDKLPDNYKIIGPLAEAFPAARFVVMLRDPRAIGLSLFRAYFAESGMNFAFDFREMAREMNRFKEMISGWQKRYPERVHTMAYEDLVADLEGTSKGLARFCGFEWHPDMMHPEANEQAVLTASVLQARDPVHTRSVRAWEPYEKMLSALIRGLDPALWPQLEPNSPS